MKRTTPDQPSSRSPFENYVLNAVFVAATVMVLALLAHTIIDHRKSEQAAKANAEYAAEVEARTLRPSADQSMVAALQEMVSSNAYLSSLDMQFVAVDLVPDGGFDMCEYVSTNEQSTAVYVEVASLLTSDTDRAWQEGVLRCGAEVALINKSFDGDLDARDAFLVKVYGGSTDNYDLHAINTPRWCANPDNTVAAPYLPLKGLAPEGYESKWDTWDYEEFREFCDEPERKAITERLLRGEHME